MYSIAGIPYPMVIVSSPYSDALNMYRVTWDRVFTGGHPIFKIVIKTRKVCIVCIYLIWNHDFKYVIYIYIMNILKYYKYIQINLNIYISNIIKYKM